MGFGRAAPRREVPRPSSPQANRRAEGPSWGAELKGDHGTSDNGS